MIIDLLSLMGFVWKLMEPVLAYITKSTVVKDDTDNIARNKLINEPQKAMWNAISGGVGSLPQDPITLVA